MPDEDLLFSPLENLLLILKAIFKVVSIFLFTIGFFPISSFVSLLACFVGYFSLPSTFKEVSVDGGSKVNYSKFQSWLRIIIALLLAGTITYSFGLVQAWSLGVIAAAYFIIIPSKKPEPYETKIEDPLYWPDKLLFSGLMAFSLVGIFTWGLSNEIFWTIIVVWIISFISGFFVTRANRPNIGIFMVTMSIFVYSFTFTGLVGQAIFGGFWPAVEQYGTVVARPVGDAWYQVSIGVSDAWLVLSCPTCYYERQAEKERTKSQVVAGGSVLSMEVARMEFLDQSIDPTRGFAGYAELENKGEFKARDLRVFLIPPQWKNERNQLLPIKNVEYNFTSCSGTTTDSSGKCAWGDEVFPGDVKLVSFVFGNNSHWGELNQCQCRSTSPIKVIGDIVCDSSEVCQTKYSECLGPKNENKCIKEFKVGAKTINIAFNYTFNYNVDVSLPVDVMNSDALDKALIAKQLTLKSVESQYSGGPVRASIWTQRQPVRDGEESFGTIAIYNQGRGTLVRGASYDFYLPNVSSVNIVSENLFRCKQEQVKDAPFKGYTKLGCTLQSDLGRDSFARLGFTFKYDLPVGAEKRSVILVGFANYDYRMTSPEKSVPLSRVVLIQ